MKKIYRLVIVVLCVVSFVVKGFSQVTTNGVSVLTVTKGAQTPTTVDITFTLTMSPGVASFYSCNFKINHGLLSNPTFVSSAFRWPIARFG